MSEVPERIVPSCVEALENYQQADMEGIMVLASRQAIHETIDAYWARVETCEELEAKLAKAVEAMGCIARQKKTDELETEYDVEVADFEAGYDTCIDVARATLAELTGEK